MERGTSKQHLIMEVPNKMKFFIWKCCNHASAVKINLKHRHIRVDNVCGVCGQVDETENHIFFRCETSHRFWFCSPLQLNSYDLEGPDFLQSWAKFCNRVEKLESKSELLQEFVFGLWRLWKNRNNMIFNQRIQSPAEILETWKQNLADYRVAMANRKLDLNPGLSLFKQMGVGGKTQWKMPCFGELKINIDAAWCKTTKGAGLGWVVRDFAGVLQAAGGTGRLRFHSAASEAAAIREALFFCLEQKFESVIVESDAKSVIQMIRKETPHDFRIDSLLSDIEFLARSLKSVTFVFVARESNKTAHSVAKFFMGKDRDFVWDAIGPEFFV